MNVTPSRLTYEQKRCVHFAGAETPRDLRYRTSTSPDNAVDELGANVDNETQSRPGSRSIANGSLAGLTDRAASLPGAQEQTTPPSATSRRKFVSDLNPESTLLNRPVPATNYRQKQPNGDIGVWVDRKEWDTLVKQKNDAANNVTHDPAVNQSLGYNQRPRSDALGPLINIYFNKIHPILPLLDETEFRTNHAEGTIPEPLAHAMCLVAAKDAEAVPHLKLSDSLATVPPRQFCSVLHATIASALRMPVRCEKTTLIRILALTSLHTEGPEGAEEASIWLSQAIHYGQTLGIHLGQQASTPAGSDMVMKRLFWCLWALDRTNAATNGRPIIMSDVDIAIEPFGPGESGFPGFEAWLKIAHLLNKIIDFYRPTTDLNVCGWEGDYPTLEEIIDEVQGWELSVSALATIHLFYLAVGILSHRARGVKGHLPSGKSSYLRQRLFAIEIGRLLNAPESPSLYPLPILPYAISLALSVSYQHLRQSQLEHQQADARNDFRTCCRILQNLRRTWSSADVMATLAKKVLDELERAPDLASFRIRRIRHGSDVDRLVADAAQEPIPPPTACAFETKPQVATPDETNRTGAELVGETHVGQQPVQSNVDLFDNMDDVFDTFMDPNYPLNLDDMSFMDDLTPFDWNGDISAGS